MDCEYGFGKGESMFLLALVGNSGFWAGCQPEVAIKVVILLNEKFVDKLQHIPNAAAMLKLWLIVGVRMRI